MASRYQTDAWRSWESEQLARARKGDMRAWGELYDALAPPLFSQVLLPRLGVRAAAEEALSETFRVALERLRDFDGRVSLFFWLARIAMNQANDVHRERARTGKALAGYANLLGPLQDPPKDPLDQLEHQRELAKLRARIDGVLAAINPRYRQAIELRLLQDRTRQECAAALECTVPTFDVVLLRSLRAFRAEWEKPEQKAIQS
ncbi:MAG: sigma-70 family RNA polymerase sigma factor [Deltaproteobacteria bacterium]|nr:sigma-70 family RNA polymerase sigma factor [Deltaproteobacteria bacterium]